MRDAIEYYPDYLQDFEYLKAMCYSIDLQCLRVYQQWYLLRSEASLERWDSKWVKVFEPGYDDLKKTAGKHLVKRYINVTAAELADMMQCWMEEGTYDLEYDKATNTVSVKCYIEDDVEDYKKKIRDVIPCNMALVMEFAESE